MFTLPDRLAAAGKGTEPGRCLSDALIVHIPMAIKEQIWRNEYGNICLRFKGANELQNYCTSHTFVFGLFSEYIDFLI